VDSEDGIKESEFPELECEEIDEFNYPEEDLAESVSRSSSSPRENSTPKVQGLTIIPKKPGQIVTTYQKKVQDNFLKMIAPKKTVHASITSDNDALGGIRHVGVQTIDIKFGPKVNTEYLLGEVRPWGAKAEHLPQKGLGLYFPRSLKSGMKKDIKIDGPKSLENTVMIGDKLQTKALRL
jgi:hypothetical protein